MMKINERAIWSILCGNFTKIHVKTSGNFQFTYKLCRATPERKFSLVKCDFKTFFLLNLGRYKQSRKRQQFQPFSVAIFTTFIQN